VVGGVAVVALLAAMIFLQSSTPAYACANEFNPTPAPSWTPPPTASPGTASPRASASAAPAVTPPPPGYVQPDMGHTHVDPATRVKYTFCPPASGRHYNVAGQGPIKAQVYAPGDTTIPEGWVHNLEHGALVILYSCPQGAGPGCTDEGQAALDALYPKIGPTPICGVPAAQLHVFTRFDDMPYPYAALVWDVVLPLQSVDESAILDFYARQGDRFNPEDPAGCNQPTAAPATPTPVPSATTGPTPTAAPSTAPTTPAASPAPSAS
jgi:hypothetical protein